MSNHVDRHRWNLSFHLSTNMADNFSTQHAVETEKRRREERPRKRQEETGEEEEYCLAGEDSGWTPREDKNVWREKGEELNS